MFKDLFSTQSQDYARYRPTYPAALFEFLAAAAPRAGTAWDCGTGNGQAAVALAPHFERVIATDPSGAQLAKAVPHEKVTYQQAPAEASGLDDASADLIVVAQAFHWFRHAEFFAEVRRVAAPGAKLALWSYALAAIEPSVDAAVMKLYSDILGKYWEPERRLVEEGYASVRIPFAEERAPVFEMSAEWTLEQLLGYLGTWSALQGYKKTNDGADPREFVVEDLARAWGDPAKPRRVAWPLSLRVFRIS